MWGFISCCESTEWHKQLQVPDLTLMQSCTCTLHMGVCVCVEAKRKGPNILKMVPCCEKTWTACQVGTMRLSLRSYSKQSGCYLQSAEYAKRPSLLLCKNKSAFGGYIHFRDEMGKWNSKKDRYFTFFLGKWS